MVERKEINFTDIIRTSENISIKSELKEESSKLGINLKILDTQLKNKLIEHSKIIVEYKNKKSEIEILSKQLDIAQSIQTENQQLLNLNSEQLENLQQSVLSNREQFCETVREFVNGFDFQTLRNKYMQLIHKKRQILQESNLQKEAINVKDLVEDHIDVQKLLERKQELENMYQATVKEYKICQDQLDQINSDKNCLLNAGAEDISRLQAALKFSQKEYKRLEDEYDKINRETYNNSQDSKKRTKNAMYNFNNYMETAEVNKKYINSQSTKKKINTTAEVTPKAPNKKFMLDCSQLSASPLVAVPEEFVVSCQGTTVVASNNDTDVPLTPECPNTQILQNKNDFVSARQLVQAPEIEKPCLVQRSIKQFIFKRPSCQN